MADRAPARAPAWRRAVLLACATFALAAAPLARGKDAGLEPYTARYQVTYRGLNGGQIESSLARGSTAGQWLYETRAYPSLLGRIAVSPQARERSTMQVTPSGVRPMSFDFNDGSDSSSKDVRFRFDWGAGRVRGEAEGNPFDLAVQPGVQDTASVQAAMMIELLAGRAPKAFPILTGSKLREYRYWPEGTATVTTPYGRFETVVWANQRDGSTRVTKVWHAPALGYVPVLAIQYRKGQAETQMKLVALSRAP
jgi:hypothetical protein